MYYHTPAIFFHLWQSLLEAELKPLSPREPYGFYESQPQEFQPPLSQPPPFSQPALPSGTLTVPVYSLPGAVSSEVPIDLWRRTKQEHHERTYQHISALEGASSQPKTQVAWGNVAQMPEAMQHTREGKESLLEGGTPPVDHHVKLEGGTSSSLLHNTPGVNSVETRRDQITSEWYGYN